MHITWQDDSTLKIEFDAGTQTRVLSFDKSKQASGEKTWQGYSVAEWEGPVGGRGFAARTGDGRDDVRLLSREELARRGTGTGFGDVPGGGGSGLRGGRCANGSTRQRSHQGGDNEFPRGLSAEERVPDSETATITEYFQWLPPHPNGDAWLIVTTAIDDPKYLQQPFYTSTNFKREPDGSKWSSDRRARPSRQRESNLMKAGAPLMYVRLAGVSVGGVLLTLTLSVLRRRPARPWLTSSTTAIPPLAGRSTYRGTGCPW